FFKQTSGFTAAEMARVDCYRMDVIFVLAGFAFFFFAVAIVAVIWLALHIFIILRDTRICMSEKTRSFHKTMTKALLIQAVVFLFFLIAPLLSAFIIFLRNLDFSLLYLAAFMSLHSVVHTASVFGTTPPYRRFL
ncbi:hypothetical protein PENTCL1PPCAC_14253, partial [Pristionchus entomophagus]